VTTVEVRELVARMGRCRTLGLAAEVAFWLFLALVPLAFVAGLAAAKLALSDTGPLSSALATMPAVARDMLKEQLARVAEHQGVLAPTALGVFVWLASSGLHAVFDAMEIETGCARPWWKKRAIAIVGCVLFSLGVAAVALLGSGLDWIWKLLGQRVPDVAEIAQVSFVGRLARLVLGALVAFALTVGLFEVGIPRQARRGMPIVPGAVLAVVLEIVLGLGYGFYVSKAGAGGAYQAGLAVIGETMIGLYLLSIALLVGLELNVTLRDRWHGSPACP
jgi:membrane protein